MIIDFRHQKNKGQPGKAGPKTTDFLALYFAIPPG